MNRILFVVVFLLALASCNQAENSMSYIAKSDLAVPPSFEPSEVQDEMAEMLETTERPRYRAKTEPSPTPRKLIRNGSMHCEVGSLDSARTQLLALLKGYQGYVSSESAYSNYQSEMNCTLRVPEQKFDQFIVAVEGISTEVFSRNINVNDVTDQYVDIAARLSTKRALHQRYTELLVRAENVKEVIEVERELAKVLADIESSEARLKSLGDRAAYATLQLSFSTEVEPVAQAGFFSDLLGSIGAGWEGVKMAVLLGATLWPLLLFGLALFFGIRWAIERRKVNRIPA